MKEEPIEIYGKNNKFVGITSRSIVHSKGLFHRTVNIFVINSNGELFLQQRSKDKDVCPSAWDLSAAEHLKPGEKYKDAALRCLKEELNIKNTVKKLRGIHLQKNEYMNGKIKDYEFVELYMTIHNGEIKIDRNEIANGGFFSLDDIKKLMKSKGRNVTPWFLDEWNYLKRQKMLNGLFLRSIRRR